MAYFRQKGDVWYYTIEIERVGGKRKKVERAGGYSQKEAKAAYRKAIAELEIRGKYEETKMTYDELLADWKENDVDINSSENTQITYEASVKNHISPALGKYQITKITPKILQDFINAKKAKYKKSTLNTMLAILKASFSYAVQPCEYLAISPADHVTLPKYKDITSDDEEAYIFTPKEIEMIFVRFPVGHQFYIPIRIAYHTGMRLGECLAVEWKDINLKDKTIAVKHSLKDKKTAPKSGTTKSKSSKRRIPFSDKLYKILKSYKILQAENRLKYGEYYRKNDYVCTQEDGAVLTSNGMRYFGMYCHKNINEKASFHSLRHTHASILLENGFSMTYVSKRLGHSKVSTTANIYSHVTEKTSDNLKQRLEEVL